MSRLLYIKASPRGAEPTSAAIAESYIAALSGKLTDLRVDAIDLATEEIQDLDGDKVAAKMAVIGGQSNEGQRKTAWDEITAIANRFVAADRYLIAVPMWNGGISHRLKQYIDVIHQPGLLWGLDPKTGYFGLLRYKKAVLALTSGAFGPSMPSPAFGADHHSTYLRAWLNQAGVTDIEEIRFQPTLLNPDPDGSFKAAIAAARSLGARG